MKRSCGLYIFIALILILLAFSKILAGNIFYFRDFSAYVFPSKYLLKAEISKGIFPFLNTYSNLDVPFFANPQCGVFYPFSILLYLLPFLPGLKIYIILHFVIAYLSLYYFLRHALGLRGIVSFYGGISLALSGFFLSLVEYISMLATLAPFPLALAFVKKAVESGRPKYWILTGMIFSLQFLGGKPDHAALCMAASLIYALYTSFYGRKEYRKTAFFFSMSVLVFLALCMVQILPFAEFFMSSDRGMGSFDVITKGSVHPLEFLKFIIPDVFGNYAFDVRHFWLGQIYFTSFYAGIAPILLALFSFQGTGARRSEAGFFTVLFFASLFLSFGRFTPLYGLLFKYLPPVRFMQYPSKFIYFTVFSLVTLSSIGFNNYMTLIEERRYGLLKAHMARLVFFAAVLSFFMLLALAFQGPAKELLINIYRLNPDFVDFEYEYILARLIRLCVTLLIFTVPLKALVDRAAPAFSFGSFISAFAAFNLLFYGFSVTPVIRDDFFTEKPRIAKRLEKKGNARVLFVDDRERSIFLFRNYDAGYPVWETYHNIHKELMYPNINIIYGLSTPGSMWVMEPKPGIEGSLDAENVDLLSLFNVEYIYTVKDITSPAYEFIGSERYDGFLHPVNIFRNRKVMPKVRFAVGYRVAKDIGEVPGIFRGGDFDPEKEVVLEAPPEEDFLNNIPGQRVDYKIDHMMIDSGATEVDIETRDNGFLVISRRYSRNWKCLVNGERAPVYRADMFLQAVPLQKGKNAVRLWYFPDTFLYGAIISGVSLILLVLAPLWGRFWRRGNFGFIR